MSVIVYQHVDAAQLCLASIEEHRNLRGVREVRFGSDGASAGPSNFLHYGIGILLLHPAVQQIASDARQSRCSQLVFGLRRRTSEIGDKHLRAMGREHPRRRSADSMIGASDQYSFVVQLRIDHT